MRTVVACLAAAIAVAASSPTLRSQTRPPEAADAIVLGMSAAFSGASGQLGAELYRGAQAYFAEVNDKGGINGHPIVIKAIDDQYDPVRAIRNTIELIDKEHVPLLFGYVGTPTVTRVLPLIRRYGAQAPYLLFPFTGAQPHRTPPYNDYVYNLRASYLEETAGLVDNFVRVGRTRVAIFYQADAYGRSGWDGVRRALDAHNLKIVAEATYRRGDGYGVSKKAQVEALRQANPDVVISIGAYAACAAFIRDAVDAGWSVPIANVSFVGSEAMLDLLLKEQQATGRDYTGKLVNSQVVPSFENDTLPAVREYKALLARHRPQLPEGLGDSVQRGGSHLSFVSLEGFLDAKLLVEVIRRAKGEIDRNSLHTAFSSLNNFDLGIDGDVSYAFGRTQGLNQVYYTRIEKGRLVPLDDWARWQK